MNIKQDNNINLATMYLSDSNICIICRKYTKESTVHCLICNVCIGNWSHHCHFINTCISNKNKTYYIIYLMILTLCTTNYLAVYGLISYKTFCNKYPLDFIEFNEIIFIIFKSTSAVLLLLLLSFVVTKLM